MLDFEPVVWQAIREVFPGTVVKGCVFHLQQRIFKKIQKVGLQQAYCERGDKYTYLRKLMALPYLPVEQIVPAYDRLKDVSSEVGGAIQEVANYMERTWVRGSVWQPGNWCVFREMVRTNNDLEDLGGPLKLAHPKMTEYDLCVVGAGMIGSAAARHASIDPKVNVCLIGPPEPKIRSFDDGCDIYGSHYDEGRITTSLDPDPVWATLAQQSIKRYRDIKKASGIPMYNDVGTLIIRSDNSEEMSKIKRTARDHGVVVSELNHATLTAKFPYLRLADDDVALYEDNNAGYISPRKLVEAQKVISKKQGCTIIHDVVCSVERVVTTGGSYVMKVVTEGGRQVLSKAVLVATGGFTLFRHLLPAGVEPDQQLRGLTVSLLEVDEEYKKKLKYMPAVNCKGAGHPDLHKFPGNTNYPVGFYMLPPITYPDGRDYIKLGYYHDAHRVFLSSSTDVKQWFVNGNTERAEDTAKLAVSLFKGLKPRSWHGDFCIMTETPTGRPYIDTVHSQLGVAIGGNSTAAKSSDEIGRLAAGMMFGRWDSTIARDVFKFRFAQDKRQQLSNSKL